ncbi:MAG: hypothetical protein ACKOC5_14020, partial [Chloroflexota bacterium]
MDEARGISIRTRLLVLAVGLMVVALVVLLLTALTSAGSVIRTAQDTSSSSLRSQVQEYLVQINRGIAQQNALVLDRAVRDVDTIAGTTASIY